MYTIYPFFALLLLLLFNNDIYSFNHDGGLRSTYHTLHPLSAVERNPIHNGQLRRYTEYCNKRWLTCISQAVTEGSRLVKNELAVAPPTERIRNVAIIAHVDHGKTTLVDALLAAENPMNSKLNQRILDSNDQEKERGITIFSKNAAIWYNNNKINIVDTPGHADFAGEVERVINMVEGVLLVVDSVEGPKPQTRFVLQKALSAGSFVIVVVNKIDRSASRPEYVVDKTFDLFVELNATDEQADFPVIYTSAINGQSGREADSLVASMDPLLDAILQSPAPQANESPIQMLISDTELHEFKGTMGIGKLSSGYLKKGQEVGVWRHGCNMRKGYISELFEFSNISRREINKANAGDIVIVSGVPDLQIGDTIVDYKNPKPLPALQIQEPTVKITVGVNRSPLAGKGSKSKFLTLEQIKERLRAELRKNVALKMDDGLGGDKMLISGRGQMHLTVLIESMRREGFEMVVGPPQIIERIIDNIRCEPWEQVDVLVPDTCTGLVMQEIQTRAGTVREVEPTVTDESLMRIQFIVPTRNTIGLRTQLMAASRGRAIVESSPYRYLPKQTQKLKRERGNLLALDNGAATLYGINHAQERGDVYITPNMQVYSGMIVGVAHRANDISLNVCREKQLTNFRSATKDKTETAIPAIPLTLEKAIESIQDDEVVEVTPTSIRMAKLTAMK